jgi:ribosome-binding protein aMBF1 (putative translation factor)
MATGPTSTTKGFQAPRYKALVGQLIEARRASGVSQEAFTAKINRHQQFVSRYESGERRLDVVEFVDISSALQCDPVELIERLPLKDSKR